MIYLNDNQALKYRLHITPTKSHSDSLFGGKGIIMDSKTRYTKQKLVLFSLILC